MEAPKLWGLPEETRVTILHGVVSCLSSFGHKLWLCSSYRSKRQLAPCSNSWQLQQLDRNSSPIWRWRKRSEQIFKIIIHKMSALITVFPDYPPTWGSRSAPRITCDTLASCWPVVTRYSGDGRGSVRWCLTALCLYPLGGSQYMLGCGGECRQMPWKIRVWSSVPSTGEEEIDNK